MKKTAMAMKKPKFNAKLKAGAAQNELKMKALGNYES